MNTYCKSYRSPYVANVTALFDATYQCKEVLPDSIDEERSRELIDSIRPIPLSETDKMIYQSYDRQRQVANEQAEADVETLKHRTNILKKIMNIQTIMNIQKKSMMKL